MEFIASCQPGILLIIVQVLLKSHLQIIALRCFTFRNL